MSSASIPAYRVTASDLPDLDPRVLEALSPLLEALNDKMGRLVAAMNRVQVPTPVALEFTTEPDGTAYVDLQLGSIPTELWVTALTQYGGPINFVYSWTWTPIDGGARVYFVGLAVATTYGLKVRYL